MSLSVKKFLPHTLFGRSLMIIATPILLIQIFMTYVFYERHWSKMTDRLSFAVAGEIAIIADRFEESYDPEVFDVITSHAARSLELLVSYREDAELADFTKEGMSLQSTITAQNLSRAMDAQVRRPYIVRASMEEKWVEVIVGLDKGILFISMPERRLFSSSSYIFLLWMLGISLVLMMVAILFMRNQIRPIRKLAVAAERLGKGQDVPLTFKPEGAREVRQAANAFIKMHERIKRQMQQRTAMLAGVSHDLRTPLTRMKLQIAMLGEGDDIKDLKSDIRDMERMIDAYLDFARGEGQEQVAMTDLSLLLSRCAENARRQNTAIEEKLEAQIMLPVKPFAFERCVNNLIGNAAQFGSKVWLAATKDEHHVEITIEDNGPGIAPEKYEEVFRPFFRLDSSRNLSSGGVGLGLPIAQDIVHSHGGEITLGESGHGGLKVLISLPV